MPKSQDHNSIDALIVRHYGRVDTAVAERIQAVSLGYLFRVVSSTEMTQVLRVSLGERVRVIDYRRDLQSGYFLKNLKIWIWRIVSCGYDIARARAMMPRYEIRERDIELARLAVKHRVLRPNLDTLAARYKSHPIAQYDRILASCLRECDSYITRFAIRKLRFLTFSGFMSVEDIVLELKYYGLYGMLLHYPKVESRLHFVNVCKRAVHNFGMNMIQQHTTQGRAMLRQESDGTFSAVKLSIDASDGGYLHTENQTTDLEGRLIDAEHPGVEIGDRLTASALISTHAGKKREFLTLLCGTYDERFSDWLHENGFADNDELMDRHLRNDSVNQYVNLVAEYLGVGSYRANAFLRELRQRL